MSRPAGIDVSNRNGTFDWSKWSGHISFASIKATEGLNFEDGQFPRNWGKAAEMGLFRFAYHYGHPNTDPVKQAHALVNYVKAHGLNPHDNFVLDLEETDGMHPIDVSFWAWVFCTTINKIAPGHRVLVYTYPAFAEAGNCGKLGGWGLWIANYEVASPKVPAPWKYWRFWQGSDKVTDTDVYNGSYKGLGEYCRRDMPTPAPGA